MREKFDENPSESSSICISESDDDSLLNQTTTRKYTLKGPQYFARRVSNALLRTENREAAHSSNSSSSDPDERLLVDITSHERLQPEVVTSKSTKLEILFKKRSHQAYLTAAIALISLAALCWRHFLLEKLKRQPPEDDFPLLQLPGQLTQAQIERNLEILFGDPDPDLYEYEYDNDSEPDYDDGRPTAVPRKKGSGQIMSEKRLDPPNLEEIDSGNVDQYRVKDYHFNVGIEDYKPLARSEDAKPLQPGLSPTMPTLMRLQEENEVPTSDGPLLPLAGFELLQNKSDVAPTSAWEPGPLSVNVTLKRNLTDLKLIMQNLNLPTSEELEAIKLRNEKRFLRHSDTQEIPTKKFPKMIIIGAKKCGTTPLKMFLSHHPQFRDRPGEKHFFDRNENWDKGFEFYLDQMEHTFDDEINFEKTSDYFDRHLVPERIAKMNESVKLVAVLCDPVQRAISHYNHILNNLQNTKNPAYVKLKSYDSFDNLLDSSFSRLLGSKNVSALPESEIKTKISTVLQNLVTKNRQSPAAPDFLLTGGVYSMHLENWFKHFESDQIHLVNGAQLALDPGQVMVNLADFMNVDPLINRSHFVMNEEHGFYCIKSDDTGQEFCVGDHSKHGKSRRVSDKHPISDQSRYRLENFYAPFMDDLEALTGRQDFRKSWLS